MLSQKGVQFFSPCRRVPALPVTAAFFYEFHFLLFFLLSEGVLNGENQCHSERDHAPE
jgi:hypothetical protein